MPVTRGTDRFHPEHPLGPRTEQGTGEERMVSTAFEGSTVIVSGAASGIGEACVRRLHEQGARVIAVDVDEDRLDELVKELGDGDQVSGHVVDVAKREEAIELMERVGELPGRLYGLVNSA